jgi:2-(1,2-epoxy-1,2-dihydrophenyl)acetyl-CoA isomerase
MTQTAAPVLWEQDGAIARIRFNRPQVLNAIDVDTAVAFRDICRRLAEGSAARVVVISGQGAAFIAGGDIGRFHADPAGAPQMAQTIIDPLHQGLAILAELPQPVVVACQGAVAGAGVSLALAGEFAIAADNARFSFAYARIGTSPDGSLSWSLPRVVGLRRALELTLLGETIDAGEALRLGLVNRVVPVARLEEETLVFARRLAAGPTFAYGSIKHLLRTSLDNGLIEQMNAERAAFCRCAGTHDFAEGIAAFFEKRPAAFRGD